MSRQRRAIYKSCQLCIVYDDPIRSSRSVSGLFSDTVLVTPSDERSSSDRHRIGPSVGSDNWVSKATRQCSARVIAIPPPPSLPPLATVPDEHRRLPTSCGHRDPHSGPRVLTINLAVRWVIGFTRRDPIRYCLPRVRLSIRSPLSPAVPCQHSASIPSLLLRPRDVYVLTAFQRGIPQLGV